MPWQLWARGAVERAIDPVEPLLASWEKSTDPAQNRLRAYLDEVTAALSPLPESDPLFLHLDVDVGDPSRLLRHYDLENYLTPLFGSRALPASQFVLVTAHKQVGGGSSFACGRAVPGSAPEGWAHRTTEAGSGTSHRRWKEGRESSLARSGAEELPAGPVAVRIAWQCAGSRNWVNLWKPTGDAMGPIRGVPDPSKPFHLNDDRIVDLEMHRQVDDALGHDVVVGIWWQMAIAGDG